MISGSNNWRGGRSRSAQKNPSVEPATFHVRQPLERCAAERSSAQTPVKIDPPKQVGSPGNQQESAESPDPQRITGSNPQKPKPNINGMQRSQRRFCQPCKVVFQVFCLFRCWDLIFLLEQLVYSHKVFFFIVTS